MCPAVVEKSSREGDGGWHDDTTLGAYFCDHTVMRGEKLTSDPALSYHRSTMSSKASQGSRMRTYLLAAVLLSSSTAAVEVITDARALQGIPSGTVL